MEIKRNARTAIIEHRITVEFTPEDDFRFFSSKYTRKVNDYREYQARRVSFLWTGGYDLDEEGNGTISLDVTWNSFVVRGHKIGADGKPVETETSHDGYALKNRLDISERVLALTGITPDNTFTATTWTAER